MPHTIDIQVRFNDTDALGHVNNAAFGHWAELGRLRFLEQFEVDFTRLILARLELDFRRQVRFGDSVQLETRIDRIGTSSMHMAQTITVDGEVAADVKSVVVYFDYEAGKPAPIPEPLRTQLTADD